MYKYIYIYRETCTCMRVYVSTCSRVNGHVCIYTYIYMCVCLRVPVYVHIQVNHKFHRYMHTCISECVSARMCGKNFAHVCTYIVMCMYMNTVAPPLSTFLSGFDPRTQVSGFEFQAPPNNLGFRLRNSFQASSFSLVKIIPHCFWQVNVRFQAQCMIQDHLAGAHVKFQAWLNSCVTARAPIQFNRPGLNSTGPWL